MIYIRDDDVLVRSSAWADPFAQFVKVHEIICTNERIKHVPTILTSEIQEFPHAVRYIRQEVERNTMRPEIHGFQHIDYGKLHEDEVAKHLAHCIKFHEDNFGVRPTTFYAPWGATNSRIQVACEVLDLELGQTGKKLCGRYGAYQAMKEGRNLHRELDGKDILIHWWENTDRLKLVVEMLNADLR